MTSMVAKANSSCAQVASLSVQEKGSRNKRKFRAEPLLSDSCKVLSLPQSGCQGYEFSAEPVHGDVTGCDLCGVNEDHSDALTLELGLPSAMGLSDTGSRQPRGEGEADEIHDADWSDLTETQLEELLLTNLNAIFKSAIKKIISAGYTEEVATRAVLRSGLCYGNKDIVSNIVDNTLVYLKNGQEVDPSRELCFEDLQQLEKYVLVELVCILREVKPLFSTGDAMWCLLLCDMNVSHACALDGDSLSSSMNEGVSSATSLTATQPESKPEAVTTDANPPAPSKPTPKVTPTRGPQLGKDSVAGSLNLNESKTSLALAQMTPGKESSSTVSVSVDNKPFKATAMRQTNSEDKSALSRKVHSNSTKRESILRQKSFHLEKNHTKGTSRAAKLSGLDGLILDRKLRESAGINLKNASLRMKAIGVDVSMSQANATLSLSTTSMTKSSSFSSSKHDKLATMPSSTGTDKPPAVTSQTVLSITSQPVLSAADTELSLSLPTKSDPPQATLSSNAEVPNHSYRLAPYDKTLGQWVPQDMKDEVIMKLYPRLQELHNQLREWTEWANGKVMQAARRLGKDKAELKMLRQEKEEVERLKKEKQTLVENTMKKLSEMENALSKASGQVERANCAVRQLEMENTKLRQDMETAKLRAVESAASCQEAKIREKKTVMTFQSWEKQKSLFQEELAAERRKLTQLHKEVDQANDRHLQLEARWKQEEKAKDELLSEANSIRKEREDLEALAKSKEETVKSKAETNLQKYIDDIRELEKEISVLRLKTDSSKIAALRRGINGSYGNTVTDAKTDPASESQSPFTGGKNSFSDYSITGGVKRERECVMCLSEEMSVVFLPCAHQVVCTTCNELHEKQGMKDCPSCRSTIQRRICVRYAHP